MNIINIIKSNKNTFVLAGLVLISYLMGFGVGIMYERDIIRTEKIELEQAELDIEKFKIEALQNAIGK